jgi:hypothetical protein
VRAVTLVATSCSMDTHRPESTPWLRGRSICVMDGLRSTVNANPSSRIDRGADAVRQGRRATASCRGCRLGPATDLFKDRLTLMPLRFQSSPKPSPRPDAARHSGAVR